MCNCKKLNSYKEYKETFEADGFLIDLDLNPEDCVECYFEKLLGKHQLSERNELLSKRIKKRYDVDCSCGHYYSYDKHLKNRASKFPEQAIAPMMPKNNCYNCYLIKRYGTTNKAKIGAIKKTELLSRLSRARKNLNN